MSDPTVAELRAAVEWWRKLPLPRRGRLVKLTLGNWPQGLPRSRQGWIDLRDLARFAVKVMMSIPPDNAKESVEPLDAVVRRLLAGASAPPLDVGVRPMPDPHTKLPDPKISASDEDDPDPYEQRLYYDLEPTDDPDDEP